MLPHAPGVQMQAIPEDTIQEDSGDEEEDDPNKRISSKNLLICACPQVCTRKMLTSSVCDRPSPSPRQEDSV